MATIQTVRTQTNARWHAVLCQEVLDCPASHGVGADSLKAIQAADALLALLEPSVDDSCVYVATAQTCSIFYFG